MESQKNGNTANTSLNGDEIYDKQQTAKTNGVTKILKKKGHFKYGDKLDRIILATPILATNKDKFLVFVKWKARNDGLRPQKSVLKNSEIEKYDPQALLDFYGKMLLQVNSKKIAKSSFYFWIMIVYLEGKYLVMINEKN